MTADDRDYMERPIETSVTCSVCFGSGWVTCPDCGICEREPDCELCEGSGDVECEHCDGGYIDHADE